MFYYISMEDIRLAWLGVGRGFRPGNVNNISMDFMSSDTKKMAELSAYNMLTRLDSVGARSF